ncbi:MAG: virulence RhuM family protein [Bacteroidetes bacterium]|nr:virulence RhuM family protein [Bacteroidota bacterium]
MNKSELIIYNAPDNADFQIEVRVEKDTVWLNRQQIAVLFDRDIKTIGKHISNALKEELSNISVIAKFATTAADGKSYQVEHYSLDMIISIGYRVKSKRGIQFRIWANSVLREYLLKGYSVNNRISKIEDDVFSLKNKVNEFELQLKSNLPPREDIFYDGQIFDAWQFVSDIVKSAKSSIVLIDNYWTL